MFSKILIANRGEIALRIIRACREMGIRTVAVYSEPDVDSLHVRMADEAVCIGKAASSASYLNIPAIVSAAEITDVEAIHPGYGFLAETAHFAEICESCQITFIGPSPHSIRLMGDKRMAKEAMHKAGVPGVPGSLAAIASKEEAMKVAKKIGYPVIIKAAAGGGGKGMRVAHNDVSLINSLMTAQTEAEAAFGNPEVYIEKYITAPRHVEIQIAADKKGRVVALGERDCSVQRRHQKLIEEAPSPAVDAKLRRKMEETAVRGAKAVKYHSLGTMEFLLNSEGHFYFMEMNTRVQVEHPVTEMITGVDLIKEQIRIAAGEKLSFTQEKVRFEGHAIECRINAEDPDQDFIPCPGLVTLYHPAGGPNVRVDSHLYTGYRVPPFYDSLLAKLIVHGRDRAEAIQIMRRALDEMVVDPIKTTIPFHRRVFTHPDFVAGRYATDFLEKMTSTVKKGGAEKRPAAKAAKG
ncbi:MAG: acetyl-CoA carboxylase biotin carboxylase subunit [Candidatus Omnitrophica bacterium CG11_big_fil_rev_8_21_14_0_20_64_10]|nr:MAG: acetyl-CoA carboxylase biotin carboxylase subunit [Candidatus Omnitrophica bacterium CG11_big_fil_rev_8_21_14_0_20_64_10]